jgi:hypothetical protein
MNLKAHRIRAQDEKKFSRKNFIMCITSSILEAAKGNNHSTKKAAKLL